MAKRTGISKWQAKSIRVNQIRWELEELLTQDLTDEEKQSTKYTELLESLQSVYEHTVTEALPAKKKESWKTVLLISVATSGGAICLKLLEMLYSLITQDPPKGGP